MKHLRLYTLILSAIMALLPAAQAKELNIEGIRALQSDLSASVYSRNDRAGKACAIVKVAFTEPGAEFEGNVIGTTEYKAGEYWVYITAGSKYLKMKHADYTPLMIRFDDTTTGPVEAKKVYGVKVTGGARAQTVTFKITPPDAILTVDQKEYPTVNGVAEIALSPEEHAYMVVAPGYNGYGNKFMVYENRDNKVFVELDRKELYSENVQASKPAPRSENDLQKITVNSSDYGMSTIDLLMQGNEYEDDRVYNIAMVEEKPEFPGGETAMYKWLSDNLFYPSQAAEDGTQGRVIVEFVISKNGYIENAHIVRGRHPALDKEALRLVNSMPRWKPGHNNGVPVKVTYSLPVTFKLQ